MVTRITTISVIVAVIIFGLVVVWQSQAYKVPEPVYTVVKTDGEIEIRSYPEMLVAEVRVQGERYEAINRGFRILADFIFGSNHQAADLPAVSNDRQGNKIAMTAPVIQQQAADGWLVRFVMPSTYNKETLPKPDNTDINIQIIPPKQYAAIRFSGRNSDANIKEHLTRLQSYIQSHDIQVAGDPIMAFYNPPWILPFLRRNEILLELK